MRRKSVNTIQLYVCNLTVKLFLSLYDKTSHQKENNMSLPLTATYAPIHSKTETSEATI